MNSFEAPTRVRKAIPLLLNYLMCETKRVNLFLPRMSNLIFWARKTLGTLVQSFFR